MLLLLIGATQYAVTYVFKGLFPLKIEEFIDLCSVTNISLLIFNNSFHGYYIHGRSPFG